MSESSFYSNPWHKSGRPEYGPALYESKAAPTEHAGALIFERVAGRVWDVVVDGTCVTQRAGLRGAKQAAEDLR